MTSFYPVFSHTEQEGFEQVVFCSDRATGLKTIISIHSTRLGPSLGGCRFFNYPSEALALEDSLRLAQAMTYKAALAGLSLGGGKAVILGEPKQVRKAEFWEAYAKCVDRLAGAYITTVDSGTSPEDMDQIRKTTKYVVGISEKEGGRGDPSPTTAVGVFEGIRATAQAALGSNDLKGKRIAIQGLGHVGYPLAQLLHAAGARLVVSDKNSSQLEKAVRNLGAEVTDPSEILTVACDILAPCAMGMTIHTELIPKLRCSAVAGAANNQLATTEDGDKLHEKGIFYAPDFAINAGGLIHVAGEWNGLDVSMVETKAREIYQTLLQIFETSKSTNTPPARVAIETARRRLDCPIH